MKEYTQKCKMKAKRRRVFLVLGITISVMLVVGFAAFYTQKLAGDASRAAAAAVVTKYLEAKKNNDNQALQTTLRRSEDYKPSPNDSAEKDLGVISLSIEKVEVSDKRTQNIKEYYGGGELAKSHGWTDEFIRENMIAVYAEYTVDYDNTKVPNFEGEIEQYFYLVRADKDSPWLIWEQSYSPAEHGV